jgi:PAS domain S-box-containing protein
MFGDFTAVARTHDPDEAFGYLCVMINVAINAARNAQDELRRANEALAESQQHYQALAESLPHLVWTCRPDGQCDFLSRQWVDYTGRPAEKQLGYGWADQLHPDDRERVQAEWAQATVRGDTFDVEFRIRRADGVYRWFKTRAVPLRNASGKILKWFGSNTDVDDYKRSGESLRLSEERGRLAQQAAGIGMFEWNIQTGVNIWTPELEAMYGLKRGEFGKTQQNWEQLVHPEDRAAAVRRVEHAFETSSPVESEWRVVWPDGSMHWIVGRFQVFKDDAGNPHRLIGVNLDITTRKNAEDEIRRLNENLEAVVQERTAQLSVANRELEAFSYSVAHDLRAPLRGMSGFAGILLDNYKDKLDADGIESLHKIQGNARLMGQIIDALLSLARVTRSELHRAPTDLSALARSVAGQLGASEPGRVAEIVVQEGLLGLIDPALARTLLENLIGNAWKFTGKSSAPRVEIGATEEDGAHTFFVRDNGAGFNMAYADKLFTPFQRLHAAREFPGTGIGLATAHRIVTRHGGRMWAEGRVGHGATFFFTLPESTEHKR